MENQISGPGHQLRFSPEESGCHAARRTLPHPERKEVMLMAQLARTLAVRRIMSVPERYAR